MASEMTTYCLRRSAVSLRALPLMALLLALAGCAGSSPSGAASMAMPPRPDPRVGLRAGVTDAGQALWNLRLVSNTPSSEKFAGVTNSDLAFSGPYVLQGNYNGFQVWDISNPSAPTLKIGYLCPASQSDVSVYRNLLFVSGEGFGGRVDCGTEGVPDSVSMDRLRGIRIFDISDIGNPKYLANVQTCRGSHTHTVVSDPQDPANVYIYVSGSAPVRSPSELPGCSGLQPDQDPNSALFRIEVIRVPLAHPEQAAIVSSPRIFNDLTAPPKHGELPDDVAPAAKAAPVDSGSKTGPTQCHDITAYPAIGLAAGACRGYGLLLDIRDPANPKRIGAVADSNFSYWHSATFNNDGTKILFTDEWGGGGQPRCRATDKPEWGADAIFTLNHKAMTFTSYYKLPAAQTAFENCVAHNGSLIPIPGRDVMVQGWYQGGISVFDWTDPAHPMEIAFFDRGPMDPTRMVGAGSWSAYWYNGHIVSSEIARGLDILELTPSALLSQNEIDAAKLVRFDYLNVQDQQTLVWPPSFAVPRAYLDQLERWNGLAASRIAATRTSLDNAEKASGSARRDALTALAGALDRDAEPARDHTRVRLLADAVRQLADASS
jgi:LVIVD repeat